MIVHQRLANAILLLGLLGTIWGLENLLRRRVSPALRAYLRLTFLAIAVQGGVGLILFATGSRPAEGLHWVYGPATLLCLPVAWALSAGGDERREAVALFGGALAVFLFALRAIGTG